ncbi:hypothetical protein RAC89_03825 [Paenibacillus sp. GD4]|jgi:hypothetical protein|uniref:hypothetical protein n=1 Tax=Paenibacillus TaxID=44249 RepID=UPI00254388B0|nr:MULTISPECIES: hypothetical protein [Paenibacillus]MDQ1909634.1 hypothetical protein [Paenibacillus sp. GD4]
MTKEHTVHFKVIRGGEVKQLRGLLFLEDHAVPTAQDFEQCLRECGHDISGIVDREKFIFQARKHGEEYLIDVLEDYEQNHRDRDAENLAGTFRKQDPIL